MKFLRNIKFIIILILIISAILLFPIIKKSILDVQYKTAYKKALRLIINMTAMEKVSGLTNIASDEGAAQLYDIISGNMSVKAYIDINDIGYNSGTTIDISKYGTADYDKTTTRFKKWVVSKDNVSYLITKTINSETCIPTVEIEKAQNSNTKEFTPKENVKTMTSDDPMGDKACYIVYVDVNGLSKGPNKVSNNTIDLNTRLPLLTYDQYPIYIGINGSTAGNKDTTITGRIAEK